MDNDLERGVGGRKYVAAPATDGCSGCCTTYGTELCVDLGACAGTYCGKEVGVVWAESAAPVDKLGAALSLIDAAYDVVVELYRPQSPAQEVWRQNWLEKARALGAGVS